MKLHSAAASPFARKVRMAALELGLLSQIKVVDTAVVPGKTDASYGESVNPLRKIPALEVPTGPAIVDSSLICEYLDSLKGGNALIPAEGDSRWRVLNSQVVANGIMEAALLLRYESTLRSEENRLPVWMDEQWMKIRSGLAWFESTRPESETTIDGIALACALGYLDFRFEDFDWRHDYSSLALWHDKASQRDAYLLTDPAG